MLCQFERVIYPKNGAVSQNGFMIAMYKPCETMKDAAGRMVDRFKAIGYCLPTSNAAKYRMEGRWTRNATHGLQFEVERFEEVIIPSKEGIIAYLSSGQIKGVGKGIAERIYNAFGEETLTILDQEPKKLLTVRGISEKRLKRIVDSYVASRGARDVIAFLAPHGISPKRAVKLFNEYGAETMDIVRKHPYRLCEISGIAFLTADKLAKSLGIDPISPERVDQALLYTLKEAEESGHSCLEKHTFINNALKLLDTEGITVDMCAARAARLVKDGKLKTYDDSAYLARSATAEAILANRIVQKLDEKQTHFPNLDAAIDHEEQALKFKLAKEQKDAVKMALTYQISVITGGPGTGKTSVQRVLLNLYRQYCPNGKIICCAPTGRAGRRMAESTGLPAATVHKVLGLLADESGDYGEAVHLDADLVLVDEVSMLDVYLAKNLLEAIRNGCKLVFIGDSEQLPSVGPGAVLKEIIASGKVPVVRLEQVFRQKNGSRIAINAKLIRHGNLSLEYGPDFEFYDSADLDDSADLLESLYLKEIQKHGVDNVALLSPYRQKTETGVNAMNQRLQEKVNPPAPGKPQITFGSRTFRQGDKVMQIKNSSDISNGDIGYITSITGSGEDALVIVDYGDGRFGEYENTDLDLLSLAYASTVHKAQGAEYKSVVINLQCAHFVMLTRALLYTAITRAKEHVIIVGERKALCIAIRKTDTEQRGTKLAMRIRELLR